MSTFKLLQRQTYSILSNKCYLIICILLLNTTIISVLHFCEVWLRNWPFNKKGSMKSYNDNIGGVPYCDKLCQYVPIDVVYTWVNGSDPILIQKIQEYHRIIKLVASDSCSFDACVPSHMTALRLNLSQHISLNMEKYPSFEIVTTTAGEQWIIVPWKSIELATQNSKFVLANASFSQVYWTTGKSAKNIYTPNNTIALNVLGREIEFLTKEQLEQWIGKVVDNFWVYSQIAYAQLRSEHHVSALLEGKPWRKFVISHQVMLNITRGYYILELPTEVDASDFDPSRFEDKEELRYSLRSLEKYAPWVRKVYIVTNGQIPYWLDLSNPRLTIVTHNTIFTNTSHLPTFSSPAIETHIHRIPGLSDKFLYINDDIFFGQDIWPQDFITHGGSQKVYLSWAVPDCTPLCPWSWVGDKTCDVPCNISVCDYDGGDCNHINREVHHSHKHSLDDHEYEDYRNEKYLKYEHDNNIIDSLKSNENNLLFQQYNVGDKYQNDEDIEKMLGTWSKEHVVLSSNVVQLLFRGIFKAIKTNKNYSISEQDMWIKELVQDSNVSLFKSSVLLSKLISKYFNSTKYKKKHFMTENQRQRKLANVKEYFKKENLSSFSPSFFYDTTLVSTPAKESVQVPAKELANRFYGFNPELSDFNRKLDTFAQSLLHVNSLLNKRYGFKARKVPAHMPHLIDKHIMEELQATFKNEYHQTSSHKFRNPKDMQYSFAYFYFLMSEETHVPISKIFNEFDSDSSGTWSDREIRTILTRLYDLPLQRSSIVEFESEILHCAAFLKNILSSIVTPPIERYLDSKLPTVTEQLVRECEPISNLLIKKLGKKKHFAYTSVKLVDRQALVGFYMLTSNLSHVLLTLDKIRQNPKKFICLNDNMDASRKNDNHLIRTILLDFYHSLLPIPSQFELPSELRNRFLYHEEFLAWQAQKMAISKIICLVIIILAIGLVMLIYKNECVNLSTSLWKFCFFKTSSCTGRKKELIHKA